MKLSVKKMKTNHITNPLGYQLDDVVRLSWVVDCDENPKITTIVEITLCPKFSEILYSSGSQSEINSLCYVPDIQLEPYTRYYWRVTVSAGDVFSAETAWFETAKLYDAWTAQWITPEINDNRQSVLFTNFNVDKPIKHARAYICGLGLYYLNINAQKAGDEVLAPGLFAYDKWLAYQTYDVSDLIKQGTNEIKVALGNGWYKGRYGLHRAKKFTYGKEFALICEMHITLEDGSVQKIVTDLTWQSEQSAVLDSNIFDGEYRDDTLAIANPIGVKRVDIPLTLLEARRNLPTKIMHELKPIDIIMTPAGEVVLDMGQNMVGWFEFINKAPKGKTVHLQFGEVLQGGNFYRDNLRGALCEFKYVSDGVEKPVTQAFTFYGFRYVKLTEWHQDVCMDAFTGQVIYTDLEQVGEIMTGNAKVNKLFENTLWGQRGNFLDVPTDCPQRDERMGWTGDAQVFFGTAAFNMDVATFFEKFMYDLKREQEACGGNVPVVIPKHDVSQEGSCAWGDAATIIPWTHYIRYGDVNMLKNQYASMKAWVDYIKSRDDAMGGHRLWRGDFHFCDWLALDNEDPIGNRFGGTENTYLASCYYRHSAMLVAKAATVLGLEDDAIKYETLSEAVRTSIIDEYFTKSGRLAITTQTAYVLALYMDIVPQAWREKTAHALALKLKDTNFHLRTGFVGTPLLCRVLSATGNNHVAYRLLLQEDFPSWLYAVNMGATTIWERWNSVLPDGSISDTGMNSLNHYSYGSIMEWMYSDAAGITPIAAHPGFKKFKLVPKPDALLGEMNAVFHSPMGTIQSGWKYEDATIKYHFVVPFGAEAIVTIDGLCENKVFVGGSYAFEVAFNKKTDKFDLDTPISEIYEYPEVVAFIHEEIPQLPRFTMFKEMSGAKSLRDYCIEGFINMTDAEAHAMFSKINV